jgi:hypothetical protein
VIAILAACCSVYFVRSTARLLGAGADMARKRMAVGTAYLGAFLFFVLALMFAWVTWRAWRGADRVAERAD